ncbi:hypothetical protein ADL22_24305 [Streptomyces sp. NRRL F-4489]|uniref:hypothetical protein n=1 Tax=Streptomyces sp. NRRL F-4489 TaxID=1609095 RepID=UPI0007497017|nr:hypothetical protein [Streptomyces sp. NRRL F-4489]KUL36421.1 hypothetical protein ADL22_24305 [Streptomyces sp. NRRL F-4489]
MTAVQIAFEISSAFRETTPGLDLERARAEVAARAQAQGVNPTGAQLDAVAVEYQKLSQLLAEAGIRYSGTCFGQFEDDGDLSLGNVTIGLQPLDYQDPDLAVAGITRILAAEHGQTAEVSTLDLPCGQAALVLRQSPELRLPAEFTAAGQDIPIEVAQLQAFIPVPQSAVPGAQTLVTVTFSTPSTDHWADYCAMVVPFLRSLRFAPEGAPLPQAAFG